jgi:hypothetical protein
MSKVTLRTFLNSPFLHPVGQQAAGSKKPQHRHMLFVYLSLQMVQENYFVIIGIRTFSAAAAVQ